MKIDSVASVMMKLVSPLRQVSQPLAKPQAVPTARPKIAASHTGKCQTSMAPPNAIATRQPVAPRARFMWPMAMMTPWPSAYTTVRQKLTRITSML